MAEVTCTKVRYRDYLAAKIALSRSGRNGNRRPRDERRAYWCDPCHAWHLTSKGRAA